MADGLIPTLLEKLFGKNYSTSVWGGLMLIAMAINQAPTIINFLPDDWETPVRGIASLLVLAFGWKFVSETKSKNTTGVDGVNAQTKKELKDEFTG